MYKNLILSPKGFDGCSWYRLIQFQRNANRRNLIHSEFIDHTLPQNTLENLISSADIYTLRLNSLVSHTIYDVLFSKTRKKPLVLDIDDNYEDVDPLSDLYRVYGTREIELKDGIMLWENNEHFNIKENEERLVKYTDIMSNVDAIFVTTFKLREYALRYNKNVIVIPNSIDFDIFPSLRRDKKTIRIVWAGGSSHYPDLIEVKDSLIRIMNKYPNVEFHILGVPFKGVVKDLPSNRVFSYGWINADGHGYRLSSIAGDIGICPLKDVTFNYYKSSIKHYEYASVGMATLAKNMEPYSDDIQNEKSGLLYDSINDFEDKLEYLITHPIERISMASEAYNYVKRNRNIDVITSDWADALNGIVHAYESITP